MKATATVKRASERGDSSFPLKIDQRRLKEIRKRLHKRVKELGFTPKRGMDLRCIAYRESRQFYLAECIDLDIIVKAQTMEGAVGKLNDAVIGYVDLALKGDWPYLLPRYSPLFHRARYYARRFSATVLKFNRGCQFFSVYCPKIP